MSYDCFCDYDPPSIYRATRQKARKEHKCFECCAPIHPGEEYEYVFGVWEGYADSYKTCARCLSVRTWVTINVPCTCWAHGNMLDDCAEAIKEASLRAPDETRGLRFGFLRRRRVAEIECAKSRGID